MDILAARKKAAERAQARKDNQTEEQKSPGVERQFSEAPQAPVKTAGSADAAEQTVIETSTALSETALTPDAEAEEAAAPIQDIPEVEMLSFRLGAEEYAVLVDDVKEVLQIRDLTPVPNAPDYILGVTALRGPILPIMDLCRRLGLPPGTRDDKSRIVVVSVDDDEAGIMVDRVTGVVRISPDTIKPAPETIEHGAEFLKGIARKGERLFILLDLKKAIGA